MTNLMEAFYGGHGRMVDLKARIIEPPSFAREIKNGAWVLLDGSLVPKAVAADERFGWVRSVVTDENGNPVCAFGFPVHEVLHGDVKIVPCIPPTVDER